MVGCQAPGKTGRGFGGNKETRDKRESEEGTRNQPHVDACDAHASQTVKQGWGSDPTVKGLSSWPHDPGPWDILPAFLLLPGSKEVMSDCPGWTLRSGNVFCMDVEGSRAMSYFVKIK